MIDRKQVILLIDDDAHISRGIGDYLSKNGYDVTLAKTAEEALDKLKTLSPDLIILDIMMPGIGGLGFLREVKRDAQGNPIHPVIVLTARAGMSEFLDDSQVSGFLAKPCSGSDLLALVQRVLASHRKPEQAKPAAPVKKRVLIGESDHAYALELQQQLLQHGYEVTVAASGIEVVDAAALTRPHVVLMNDILTGMNGNAVAALLAEMPSAKRASVLLYDISNTLLRRQSGGRPLPAGVHQVMSHATLEQIIKYAVACKSF